MTQGARRAPWGLLLKIAVSALLLAWLSRSVDLAALRQAFGRLTVAACGLAVVLFVVQAAVLGWRWHRIVRWMDGRLAPVDAVRWVFIGLFFNQALPSSVGGDALRIWHLHRQGQGMALAVGSVAIERTTGMAMLALLVSAATAWLGPQLHGSAATAPLLMIGPGLVLLLAVLAVLPAGWLRRLPGAVGEAAGGVADGLRRIARRPPMLLEVVLLGAAASLLGILAAAALAPALGIALGLPAAIVLVGGAVLVSVLPVSLGGWGVREVGMLALAGALGLPPEPVIALSVAWGALQLAVALPGGLLWWQGRAAPVPEAISTRGVQ